MRGNSTGASNYICGPCDLAKECCKTRSMSHNPHDLLQKTIQGNVRKVKRNGNCFFNSMAINIKSKPDEWQHLGILYKGNPSISRHLRRILVKELLGARRQFYEERLPPEDLAPENYEEEVNKFLTPRFFYSPIGDFMPAALANALNCSIVIYFKDSHVNWVIKPTERPTAYLIYDQDGPGHYDAVIIP